MPQTSPQTDTLHIACSVSVAPIRREPSHRSEQTSQLLFGERAELLQLNAETDWAHIRCAWDGYEGWCKMGQVQVIPAKAFGKEAARVVSSTNHGVLRLAQGAIWLPAGSELTGIKKGHVPVGEASGKFEGKKLDLRKAQLSAVALLKAARSYLYAPYQWGGRSLAGIDCSGIIQLIFKICGAAVLRDAAQQATMGAGVHALAEAQPGDLAFFDNAEGRIIHVGILVNRQTIIHATDASGRVVEDRIDNTGIISTLLKKRTHNLRAIRRIGL